MGELDINKFQLIPDPLENKLTRSLEYYEYPDK